MPRIISAEEDEQMEKQYFRRRFMLARQSQTNGFERLEVTDSRTDMLWKLFDMNTPPQGMAEFGLGFGLYFDMIRALGVLAICLVLLSLVNFVFSGQYGWSLIFACDSYKLVCLDPGCAYVAKHKTCELTNFQAIVDIVCGLLIFLFIVVDQMRRPKIASRFAKSSGSADPTFGDELNEYGENVESYSIMIKDPPRHADDAEQWKEYFDKHFGDVVYVTVCKRNRPLMKLLMHRRRLLQNLHLNGSNLVRKVNLDSKKRYKTTKASGSKGGIFLNKNSRFEKDAYWMTGAMVKQNYVLTHEQAIGRRALQPNNCGCCAFLASIFCWPDSVEDIDWVAARQEEQELLLHDINDTLAAVIASKARANQLEEREDEVVRDLVADEADIQVDEHFYEAANRSHLAADLVNNGDDVVAVIVTFNVASSSDAVLNSSLGPDRNPSICTRCCQGFCYFWRILCCCCSCNKGGKYKKVANDELAFEDNYVPSCVRPPPPNRIRWWSLGAAGVDRNHYDPQQSQEVEFNLYRRRFWGVMGTLCLNILCLFVALLLIRSWETPTLCSIFLICAHYNAPMFIKALTEYEYHDDTAMHDLYYFNKLTLFRVINYVLVPFYAWKEPTRFGVEHVIASSTLLFLHAVFPPIIKFIVTSHRWRYGGLLGFLKCGKEAPEVFDSTNTNHFDERGSTRNRRSSSSHNTVFAQDAASFRERSSSRALKAVGLRRLAAMLDNEPDIADRWSHLVATFALGISMMAFVVMAPLYLLIALILMYYADKFELLRNVSFGWIRGLCPLGHYKIASHASAWLCVALLIHFSITANGYAGWPHDGLCPTWVDDGVRARSYPATVRRYGAHVRSTRLFHKCATEGGDPLFVFFIIPNIFPRWGDSSFLTRKRQDILFYYTVGTFIITIFFWILYFFVDLCCPCKKERARLAHFTEQKLDEVVSIPSQYDRKKGNQKSHDQGEDDGEMAHYLNLGASVDAYIPMTDRGFNSRLSPFDLHLIQPSTSAYPKRRVVRGLGDFIHFPLIACQEGKRHFIPHHLPWRHPLKDLTARDAVSNAKMHNGLAGGYGSREMIDNLTLYRPREFPHIPVAAGLVELDEMGDLLKNDTDDHGVDVMMLLKKANIFSTIHLFGEYAYDSVEEDDEDDDCILEGEEVNMEAGSDRDDEYGQDELDDLDDLEDQGAALREQRRLKEEAALRDRALKAKSEKERLLAEKAERDRLAAEKAERDRLAKEKRAREKAELEEEARLKREKKERERLLREEEMRLERERRERERLLREEEALLERERRERERALREEEALLERERIAAERRAIEDEERERLAREKRERDIKLAAKKKEAERLAAEEAAAAAFMAEAAENARLAREEAEARKRKLREQREAREAEEAEFARQREAKRLADREAARKRAEEASRLRMLRKQKVVKAIPKSSVPPRDLGGNLRSRINSVRIEMIKGLAEHRDPLSEQQLKDIEFTENLVYMWPLEDGDKLTEEVKPWPCEVNSASQVKLTMPKPCGRTFEENEKAWTLVFGSFLNTPGTPYRSHLKFTPQGKLTPGTGYMASVLDARVVRIPKGDDKKFVDVEYLTDTTGKEPRAGDKKAAAQLIELKVPVARISSREEYQRIFVGAAIRVTKIVQRTFEFVDGAAAHDAMTIMNKNSPKLKKGKSKIEDGLGAIGEEDDEDEEEDWENDGQAIEDDDEEENPNLDARFGLIHGNCRFEASRPLKVKLEGLEEYDLALPNADSIRIASEGDEAPEEQLFPRSSKWGDGVDPAKQTVWDPKALKVEGMPLRFVNNRKHCSVVYKICSLVDIDKSEAEPMTAAKIKAGTIIEGGRTNSDTSTGIGVGAKYGIESRNSVGDLVIDVPSLQAKGASGEEGYQSFHNSQHEYAHEPIVVYIRPGETAWVKSPPGVYHLRLCEGRKWFGDTFKFGPSAITIDKGGKTGASAGPAQEPFANYGMSKWRYPKLWLYRSRVGRWLITPEDPTLVLTPYGDEEPDTEDEEEKLRNLYIRDVGLFRTKDRDVSWPHDSENKGEWEVHKGSACALADSDDEDEDDDAGASRSVKPWGPFSGLKVSIDKEAFSVPKKSGASSKKNKDAEDDIDPVAGPAGFVLQGLPLLVEDKGAFLRVAKRNRSGRNARESFGGLSSLAKPLHIHGAPVFRFDPRYQFLRGLYSAPQLDDYQKFKRVQKRRSMSNAAEVDEDDEEVEEGQYSDEMLERGRAGPEEGAWWLDLRDSSKDAGTFAREVLRDLDEEGAEISDFFSTWSAATFEVPEKRIRTVLWPQSS